jgi:hypothetical protein
VSALTAGLVQGLREVPAIVGSFEPEIYARALDTHYSVLMRKPALHISLYSATFQQTHLMPRHMHGDSGTGRFPAGDGQRTAMLAR